MVSAIFPREYMMNVYIRIFVQYQIHDLTAHKVFSMIFEDKCHDSFVRS